MGSIGERSSVGEGTGQELTFKSPVTHRAEKLAETDRNADGQQLSESEIFEVLYNRRRREIVEYLRSNDGAVRQGDLAEHLAAKETDQPQQDVSSYDRKRLYIGLYQNHLPKLAEMNVIAYDKNRGTIELRDTVRQLEPYLDRPHQSPSPLYDLIIALGLGVVLVFGLNGVSVFGAVDPITWIGLGLAGVLGLVGLRKVRQTKWTNMFELAGRD